VLRELFPFAEELELDPSAGNVVVITSWSPALRPLMIWVRLSPLRPTTTCCPTVLPCRCTLTVASDPLPLTASFGTVRPCACPVITEAEALIPGLTLRSR
jgi:hypothetical protein